MADKARETAAILARAGGICGRCDSKSPALTAVQQTGGVVLVECLNRKACDRRVRQQLAEEDQ
jgi:hypothetical protein